MGMWELDLGTLAPTGGQEERPDRQGKELRNTPSDGKKKRKKNGNPGCPLLSNMASLFNSLFNKKISTRAILSVDERETVGEQ